MQPPQPNPLTQGLLLTQQRWPAGKLRPPVVPGLVQTPPLLTQATKATQPPQANPLKEVLLLPQQRYLAG